MQQILENLNFTKSLTLLSFTIDLIEGYPLGHGHAIATFCQIIAKAFGITINNNRLIPLIQAALVHDLGKYLIKEETLKNINLTYEEVQQIWQHPANGANILHNLEPLKNASFIVRWHHENLDGSGYPDNLYLNQIPLESKILALADSFISMLCKTSYRRAKLEQEILNELKLYVNSKYEPKLLKLTESLVKNGYSKTFFKIEHTVFLNSILNIFKTFPKLELSENDNKIVLDLLKLVANIIDNKTIYKQGHSIRVANFAKYLAEQLKLSKDEINITYITGLLHDLGMLKISSFILDKPRRLSQEEYELIKQHPKWTYDILNLIPGFEKIAYYSYFHHERYNGSGYPKNIKGEKLPIISQIIAVCDSFDAMTSLRSYRKIVHEDIAMSELRAYSGTLYDPVVINALSQIYRDFKGKNNDK